MDSSQPAPSGSFLPYFLRKKWKAENGDPSALSSTGSSQHLSEEYPEITRAEKSRIMHRIFTAQEIEDRMQQISKNVLVDIQKQIYKGEEAYYEDTYGHGSLFRGWDAFVDSKEVGVTSATSVPQGTKRIPADYRWFSSSSRGALKPARSSSVVANLPPGGLPSVVTSSSTPSVTSASIVALLERKISMPEKPISSGDATVKMEVTENEPVESTTKVTTESAESTVERDDKDVPKTTDRVEGTKRKNRNETEQQEEESTEPSNKKSRDNDDQDKSIQSTSSRDVIDEEVKPTELGTVDIDEEKKETVVETEVTKRTGDEDQDTQKECEETNPASPTKEDQMHLEEPQKRRSSRNRRAS